MAAADLKRRLESREGVVVGVGQRPQALGLAEILEELGLEAVVSAV